MVPESTALLSVTGYLGRRAREVAKERGGKAEGESVDILQTLHAPPLASITITITLTLTITRNSNILVIVKRTDQETGGRMRGKVSDNLVARAVRRVVATVLR